MEGTISNHKVYEDVRHVIYRFRFQDLGQLGLLPLKNVLPAMRATQKNINPGPHGARAHIITSYHCPNCSCLRMMVDNYWGMELEMDRTIKERMCDECMQALLRMGILDL